MLRARAEEEASSTLHGFCFGDPDSLVQSSKNSDFGSSIRVFARSEHISSIGFGISAPQTESETRVHNRCRSRGGPDIWNYIPKNGFW